MQEVQVARRPRTAEVDRRSSKLSQRPTRLRVLQLLVVYNINLITAYLRTRGAARGSEADEPVVPARATYDCDRSIDV